MDALVRRGRGAVIDTCYFFGLNEDSEAAAQLHNITLYRAECTTHIIIPTCDANTTLQRTRHRRACINDNPFACVELYIII